MASMPKGGRMRGARDRLSSALLEDLLAEWREGGRLAVQQMRLEKPAEYVRAMIAVLPREFTIESTLADLDDQALDELILQLGEYVRLDARQEPALIEGEATERLEDEREPEPEPAA